MLQLFLFLHVMGAIIAFGPTFAFSLIAGAARRDPQHGHFAAVVSDSIERRIVIPGAIVQGVTGVALLLIGGFAVMNNLWLQIAIPLYVVAILYAVFLQAPAASRMVELTKSPPPPGATGPSPEMLATAKRLQQGGIILTVLIVVIVILMVTKPML
jgi:uncharacterized membrane protein